MSSTGLSSSAGFGAGAGAGSGSGAGSSCSPIAATGVLVGGGDTGLGVGARVGFCGGAVGFARSAERRLEAVEEGLLVVDERLELVDFVLRVLAALAALAFFGGGERGRQRQRGPEPHRRSGGRRRKFIWRK